MKVITQVGIKCLVIEVTHGIIKEGGKNKMSLSSSVKDIIVNSILKTVNKNKSSVKYVYDDSNEEEKEVVFNLVKDDQVIYRHVMDYMDSFPDSVSKMIEEKKKYE